MTTRISFLALTTLALLTPISYADELTHIAAHVGASATINTWCYGFFHKAVGMGRVDSLIMSGVTTLFIGATYKLAEAGRQDHQFAKTFNTSMGRNALGVGVSIATVYMFKF